MPDSRLDAYTGMVKPCTTTRPGQILVAILLGVAVLGSMQSCAAMDHSHAPHGPLAREGVLDLRYMDWARVPMVDLSGTWEFQPGTATPSQASYRSIPDTWEGNTAGQDWGQGYGTYRLKVLLPPVHPPLGIRYTTVSTAFELDANGSTIAHAGLPRPDPAIARPAYNPGVAAIPDADTELVLEVRVSNYEYRSGGMWRSFKLGDLEALEVEYQRGIALSLMLAAFTLAMSFVFFVLYLFRRKDQSYLWFALFALVIVARPLCTGDYLLLKLVPDIPFDLLIRLEYCTAFLPFPLGLCMFITMFGQPPRLGSHKFMLLPFVPFLVCIPLLPLPLLTRIIFVFYLACLPPLWGTLRMLYRAIRHQVPGSILMTLGGLVLLGTAINDILYASFIIHTANLLPLGITCYVAFQSAALGRTLAYAHNKVERMVLEVHHRVKNSLQIVSSLLSLHAMRTLDPKAKEAFRFMKEKIRAISMVHEKLYSISGHEEIQLGGYLKDLMVLLGAGYREQDREPGMEVHAEELAVPAGFCMDCGLMVAELVSNAFKHHKGTEVPALTLSMRREGLAHIVLELEDNGPGFPRDFDWHSSTGQGFTLLDTLAHNHMGTITTANGARGARVSIRMVMPGKT